MDSAKSQQALTNAAKVVVLGSGNYGTAIGNYLSSRGATVTIVCREKNIAEYINREHRNPNYLNEFTLDERLRASTNFENLATADFFVVALPTQFVSDGLKFVKVPPGAVVVSCAKGIDRGTLRFPMELIRDALPDASLLAVLSGPSFASEIVRGLPTAVTVASDQSLVALAVQKLFHSEALRVYTSKDPVGLEVAGAVKNVIAIASGAVSGLKLGQNSRAALITRGLAEMTRLGVALGAHPLTFSGLGGVGDLFLTCTSELSRNFRVGVSLAEGRSLAQTLRSLGSVAEGVNTAPAVVELAKKLNVEVPICQAVHDVLNETMGVSAAMVQLVTRAPRTESWT